ncbi:hypothetical protein [Paracoccus beibuensis]|uniref:hypothetical protein n=1 Tax=Paracoccus beibuensis TaxID=547602 RepID=UPI00223EB68C|nr:hypothetical protein [Paracoccus beibuensis]
MLLVVGMIWIAGRQVATRSPSGGEDGKLLPQSGQVRNSPDAYGAAANSVVPTQVRQISPGAGGAIFQRLDFLRIGAAHDHPERGEQHAFRVGPGRLPGADHADRGPAPAAEPDQGSAGSTRANTSEAVAIIGDLLRRHRPARAIVGAQIQPLRPLALMLSAARDIKIPPSGAHAALAHS